MKYLHFIFATIIIIQVACKSEPKAGTTSSDPKKTALINENLDNYQKDPSDANYSQLMKVYGEAIVVEENKDNKVGLLVAAIKESEKAKKHEMAMTFGFELIKNDPLHPTSKAYFGFLADRMKMKQKDDIAAMITAGYLHNFGTKGENEKIMISLPSWHKDPETYLKEAGQKIFINPDLNGQNMEATRNYVDLCEAYAVGFSKNPETPEYLFKSAEMARSINDLNKTLSIYEWIIKYYPDHKHAPMCLFLKGFTLENEFKKYDLAKTCYNTFLLKYPADPMAKDVKFLLQNLGKADSTIIKGFDNK